MGLVSRGETDWRGKTSLLNWILINALVIIMDGHHYQTQKEACLSNFIFKALIIFMKSTMNPLSFSVAAGIYIFIIMVISPCCMAWHGIFTLVHLEYKSLYDSILIPFAPT